MKIYVDMLFAINFSMDFVSLFLTLKLLHKPLYKKRILASSALGGFYGVFDVLASQAPPMSLLTSVLVSFLMCFICFKEGNKRRFIGAYAVYWGVSACLGGFMSLLYSFLNKTLAEYIERHSYTTVYNGARFFIISAISIIASLLLSRALNNERQIEVAEVFVEYSGKSFTFKGLCDSGNLLTEPFSGKAVILVTNQTQLGKEIEALADIYKRYIPYDGVGGHGFVKGIKPQVIKINNEERSAIIAPINKKEFGGYEACVPMMLIN